MKLVKCRKCGTAVMTDSSLLETMVEEMNECNRKAIKAKPSDKNVYVQQASQLKKMISQIQHRITDMESRKESNLTTLSKLKAFVVDNELMTWEQIDSIEKQAIKEAEIKGKKDKEEIEKIYGIYRNGMANRTNKDATAKEAMKGL